jgi:hypothetical protein
MEADEVYSQLSDKISDLTSKDSEFQGTIDYLQSSITDLKNAVDSMKTDMDFVKSYVQNRQADSQAAGDAADLKAKYNDIINANLKLASDAAAAQKAADANAGLLTKLGSQMDDAYKTFTSTDTLKTIVTTAVDNSKKEILGVWDNAKKEITNSLSDYVTGKIKEAKADFLSGAKDLFGQEDEAKPKPVLESDLEAKVKDIITSVQAENASAFEEKVRAIIAQVQEEKKA